MSRLLLIAARNLLQHRGRTLMLGSAIALVTLLLVLLTSVSRGVQDTMLRAATTIATGHVNIAGFYKITSGQAAPVVTRYEPLVQWVRQQVPEARLVVDRLRGWGKLISPTSSVQVGVRGVDIDTEPELAQVLSIVQGDLRGLRRPHTALLFAKQAEKLAVRVGDTLTLSAPTVRGANNAVDVEVVAIARNLGLLSQFNIFAPKQTVREIYLLKRDTTGAIQLLLRDPTRAPQVAERLRTGLLRQGQRLLDAQAEPFWMKIPIVTREDWTGQKLDVTTWRDELAMLTWILTAFDTVTFVVVGILLVIIVIGVMNALWISIRERTREIGTLRAIGMGRGRVLLMFMLESGLLALTATAIGALLGVAGAHLLNAAQIELSPGFAIFLMSDTLQLAVWPRAVIGAAALISGVITCFALYPAYRAARLRPVLALHDVG